MSYKVPEEYHDELEKLSIIFGFSLSVDLFDSNDTFQRQLIYFESMREAEEDYIMPSYSYQVNGNNASIMEVIEDMNRALKAYDNVANEDRNIKIMVDLSWQYYPYEDGDFKYTDYKISYESRDDALVKSIIAIGNLQMDLWNIEPPRMVKSARK